MVALISLGLALTIVPVHRAQQLKRAIEREDGTAVQVLLGETTDIFVNPHTRVFRPFRQLEVGNHFVTTSGSRVVIEGVHPTIKGYRIELRYSLLALGRFVVVQRGWTQIAI